MNCVWHLVYLGWPQTHCRSPQLAKKGTKMSKIASFHAVPAVSPFSRFMATVDRWLMASARVAIRNGDLPHPGL
jgi:hypothetical protein